MRVIDWIKEKIKNLKKDSDTNDTHRYESIRIDTNRSASIHNDTNRYESSDSSIRIGESLKPQDSIEDKNSIKIEKDALKIGVAAGYLSRYLIDIDDSLKRIESLMASKEWFLINILPKLEQGAVTLNEIKDIISKHEMNDEKRFEILYEAINKLKSIEYSLPENSRNIITETINSLKKASLTPKMEEILKIVKENGEISYAELAEKTNVSVDSLRGILSKMCKITDDIERFEKNGKGWVRYKAIPNDTNRYESNSNSLSQKNDIKFEINQEEW